MSIESQRAELRRAFGERTDIEVLEVFEESKSAKAPGRPLFNSMMQRIEAGEAQGVLAWAPDRLARNSIDGGRLVYQLDCGVLKDLKFATYTFENNPQGKFMLSIMFGQSKYYSDALSENVQRGMRAKLDRGWRPARPPFGYVTDITNRTTVLDPLNGPLIRRMFDMMLSGSHTATQIALTAQNEWGLSMAWNRRSKGKLISVAAVHRILHNPFYAGVIVWRGNRMPGKHQALVTMDEFERVRLQMARPGKKRPQKHEFAFTGLIRCACGLMITAERRNKPSGRSYTYYHCSKRMAAPRCTEPAVTAEELERQLETFISSVAIPQQIEEFLLKQISVAETQDQGFVSAERATRADRLSKIQDEFLALTELRLKRLIDDDEFSQQRERLLLEKAALAAAQVDAGPSRFELCRDVVSFSKQAVECFRTSDSRRKQEIVRIVGSNPVLSKKKLSIQAVKPFQVISNIRSNLSERGLPYDVRTNSSSVEVNRHLKRLLRWIGEHEVEVRSLVNQIEGLRHGPEDKAA